MELMQLLITKPPQVLGREMSSVEMLDYVRNHLAEFMDPAQMSLTPLAFDDKFRWGTKSPSGTIFRIDYKGALPEQASVVVSDSLNDRWGFTNIYSGIPGVEDHRIAGTRWFGISFTGVKNQFIFFTKTAYRALQGQDKAHLDAVVEAESIAWKSLLLKVKEWVEKLGGKADLDARPPVLQLEPWETARATNYYPLEKWTDVDGNWESREVKDGGGRFRLELEPGMAGGTLIERGSHGRELRKKVLMSGAGQDTWTLSRAQDEEVLRFYGVSDEILTKIMEGKAPPSVLSITKAGDKLKATWAGLRIQKNIKGELDRFFIASPKPYDFLQDRTVKPANAPEPPPMTKPAQDSTTEADPNNIQGTP
jgi:hypothetical protein